MPGTDKDLRTIIDEKDGKSELPDIKQEDIENVSFEERVIAQKDLYNFTDKTPAPLDPESMMLDDAEMYQEIEAEVKEKIEKGITESYNAQMEECLHKLETGVDPELVKLEGKLHYITHYLAEENLSKYSPKFKRMLDNITNSKNKNALHLVYSQFRRMEGIGIFRLVLDRNGFNELKLVKSEDGRDYLIDTKVWDKPSYYNPKYILYTGQEDTKKKEILKDIFNSNWDNVPKSLHDGIIKIYNRVQKHIFNKETPGSAEEYVNVTEINDCTNKYGDIIQVIMITSSGAEGISLKNVRHVHITEPFWHPVRNQQIIGRARRICSHKDLREDERDVTVYLYLMNLKNKERCFVFDLDESGQHNYTTDYYLHNLSENKKQIVSALLHNLKEASIDCTVYNKVVDGKQLNCLSFIKPHGPAYDPTYEREEQDDSESSLNVRKKKVKSAIKAGPSSGPSSGPSLGP